MEFGTSIGFIGLGSIGKPMAANLITAGYKVRVHTRSRIAEKDEILKGSIRCSSPREVAENTSIIFTCLTDAVAVENVIFGPSGINQNENDKLIIIDCSTISPSEAISISHRLEKKGIEFIDAPVTGGTEAAYAGRLTILLGGGKSSIEKVLPILKVIGEKIVHFGEVGNGQKVKAINQTLVAGTYMAVAEAIMLGESLKLPMFEVIDALINGAGGSWALTNRSKNMIEDNYPLGFKLELHKKDLDIALGLADESKVQLPITERIRDYELRLIESGFGSNDVSVIKRILY